MSTLDILAAKSAPEDQTKWLSFCAHANDTAGIMELLFNKWLSRSLREYLAVSLANETDLAQSEDTARRFCAFLALMHDIGKLTPAFQSKIAGNIADYQDKLESKGLLLNTLNNAAKSPHDLAGLVIMQNYLHINKNAAAVIGTHHGKIYEGGSIREQKYMEQNYFGRKCAQEKNWRSLWEEWLAYALEKTEFTSVEELPVADVKAQMLLCGLLIMSDWIASNQSYFPTVPCDYLLSEEEFTARIERAWELLALPGCWYAEDIYEINSFFRERFGFFANTVQAEFMTAVSENMDAGIYILEAPMGIGKTEAALAAAEMMAAKDGFGGIYFGLPTQATANGIFGRIRAWAESCDEETHSIRLAHGMVELNDEYQELFRGRAEADIEDETQESGVFIHEWFEGRKQALLADFVIATVDQFLLASLKQRHVMLRHLGLAGKVVIIDECHAYDAYMNVYLDNTLRWMGAYRVPVIILSATLPPARRVELIEAYLNKSIKNERDILKDNRAYPLLTWTDEMKVCQKALSYNKESKHITVKRISEEEITAELKANLADGGCAAVIVNSVNFSQSLSRLIQEEMPDFTVKCFHSRFIAQDRAQIEKEILSRVGKHSTKAERSGLIVVATQVLEQSLDVDFDFMITELCPMDLLLQRAGRLWRHNRERPKEITKPQLAVIMPENNKNSVYDEWVLNKSAQYLPEELVIPECIPALVSQVYTENISEKERLSEARTEYERKISNKKENAKKYCIKATQLRSNNTEFLYDILDGSKVENDSEGEMKVRDTDESIEVLALKMSADRRYHLLSEEASFAPELNLTNEEGKLIAKERLRLPAYFSKNYNFDKTMHDLSALPKNWQDNKWLKGEILLLFDENNEVLICGKKLGYSKKYGLEEINEKRGEL